MTIGITVLEKVLVVMTDRQCNLMVVKMTLSPTKPTENGHFLLRATAQMIVLRLLVVCSHLQPMGTGIGVELPRRILHALAHLLQL
jgi:hypothetical protein